MCPRHQFVSFFLRLKFTSDVNSYDQKTTLATNWRVFQKSAWYQNRNWKCQMNLNSGVFGPFSGGFEPADLSSSFAARPVWVWQPDSVLPGAWHAGGAGGSKYICYLFNWIVFFVLFLLVLVFPVPLAVIRVFSEHSVVAFVSCCSQCHYRIKPQGSFHHIQPAIWEEIYIVTFFVEHLLLILTNLNRQIAILPPPQLQRPLATASCANVLFAQKQSGVAFLSQSNPRKGFKRGKV